MIRFPSRAADAPMPQEQMRGTRLSDWVSASSTYEIFRYQAATHGGCTAFTHIEHGGEDEVPRSFTYAEVFALISRAANVLLSHGADRRGAVGLLLPSLPEQQWLLWGAEAVSTAFPMNYLLEPKHLAELLVASNTRILVAPGPAVDSAIWAKAMAVREAMGSQLGSVIQVGGEAVKEPGIVQFEDAMACAAEYVDPVVLPGLEDIAALFHTGGTTGAPKIVRHTHHNQIAAAFGAVCAGETTATDVGSNGYPMFHVAGAVSISLGNFVRGGNMINLSSVGYRNPSIIKNYWGIVERYRITICSAVATAMAALAQVPTAGRDISSLRVASSGGAFVPRAVAERFERAAGVPLRETYGMTESASVIAVEPGRGERVLGSAGFAAPFVDIEIRQVLAGGDVGAAVAPRSAGALVIRGENVTPGYLNPKHNEGAFTPDGWFITGDLASMDETGRVTLLGRSKDLIIRSGHNIDPQGIEEVAMAHPAVIAAAAVGQPDRYAGELPVCYVTLRPDAAVTPDELAEFIAARVPERPAAPKSIFFLDALPLTSVGKVFKPALRCDAASRTVSALLADLPIQEVSARDSAGGAMMVTIAVLPGSDMEACRREVAQRLSDYLFKWELTGQGAAAAS